MVGKIFLKRIIKPFGNPINFFKTFPNYLDFFRDMIRYSRIPESEKIKVGNLFPILHDSFVSNQIDPDYFYQDIWAFKKIYQSRVKQHVDIASKVDFVGFLSSVTEVVFVDIRRLTTDLKNLEFKKGNILNLPFKENSLKSLSCLSVAEHIGLGRYGDPLDPRGTEKACRELKRVLSPGGNLYFAMPIGKPKVLFNAHRIHSIPQVLGYFKGLRLIEFSYINSEGRFIENASIQNMDLSKDINGLFHFRK